MRKTFTAKTSGFVLGLTLAAAEGCIFDDCLYFASYGYQACGRLLPVESQTSQGPVMIEAADGLSPSGCTCVTESEKELLESDPSNPELDPIYVKIQADAQLECIALAEELGADAAPCMTATLDKETVLPAQETSEACWYVWGTSDSEKCPIPEDANDDDVGTSDGESGSESDSGSDGDSGESGPPLPDLPGDKLP